MRVHVLLNVLTIRTYSHLLLGLYHHLYRDLRENSEGHRSDIYVRLGQVRSDQRVKGLNQQESKYVRKLDRGSFKIEPISATSFGYLFSLLITVQNSLAALSESRRIVKSIYQR